MTETRAARLTAEAARRLRRARAGRVHSAFARTVNLELDGLGDAAWLSLHGLGAIPSPFGIACADLPDLRAFAGAPVEVRPDAVLLDGRLRVRLDGARVCDTTLPAPAPMPAAACLTWACAEARGGLLPVVAAWLRGAPLPSDPLTGLAAPALDRLAAATRARDVVGCVTAAGPLLGLGPGLTPSGDDALVGWIAGAWAAEPGGWQLVEALRPDLLAAAAARTGVLSRAFLAAALAGHVAEPFHRFVTSPGRTQLSALLALGATSGADLLAGYLFARHALAAAR